MDLTSEDTQQLNYLIEWVNARVDELLPNGQTPEAPIGYIEEELDNSALYILRTINKQIGYSACKTADASALTVTDNPDNDTTLVGCPEDYVRFMRIRMAGWKRAIDQLISVDSNRYRQQSNRFLQGNTHKPTAFLVPSGTAASGMAIEVSPGGEVTEFIYVPRLRAFQMPKDLQDPMIWLTAARTLTILRQGTLAQSAMYNMQLSMSQLRVGMYGEEVRQQPANEADS